MHVITTNKVVLLYAIQANHECNNHVMHACEVMISQTSKEL